MKPCDCRSMPAESRRKLEKFKEEIASELKRCRQVKDFNWLVIDRMREYYDEIQHKRFMRDPNKGNFSEYLYPDEKAFEKFINEIDKQIIPDQFDRILNT